MSRRTRRFMTRGPGPHYPLCTLPPNLPMCRHCALWMRGYLEAGGGGYRSKDAGTYRALMALYGTGNQYPDPCYEWEEI